MNENIFESEFEEDFKILKDEINPPYFIKIGLMNEFEQIETYKDLKPLLSLRKKIWFIKAYKKIKNQLFKFN